MSLIAEMTREGMTAGIGGDKTAPLNLSHLHPVLGCFFEETRSPSQAEINYLISRGTPNLALAYDSDRQGLPVGAAHIIFVSAHVFDFAEPDTANALAALIFVARDAAGDPLDLVAWAPRCDRLASHLDRAPLLGEHDFGLFQIFGPPMIHRHIRGWLRAGREGGVIVDPKRAARVLNDMPTNIMAEDAAHAAELAKLLLSTVDLSRVKFPRRAIGYRS